ncbi:MAG: RecX family transcriptional regulator [Lachnospiraceae bacterium]|nr:RecX family transcriptional regulator [Lachnospiraceae bacterium]
MVVTQITELSKSRCKVYIDREFAFVLYKGELRLYRVAEGKEISQKDYEELIKVVLPRRAKLRAMNLLQKRAYTEKQLRDKLEEGCYPEKILEEAIAYVKSYRYVDDVQYAVDYISCYEERKSAKMLEMQLLSKGVSKENIREAFARWREQGGIQDEESMIRELLEKKHYDAECDIKEKNRIYGFLLRKGFSPDKIQEAMKLF